MKKTVVVARVIFWIAFVVFMITLFERGKLLTFIPPDSMAFILWASGFLMFVGFQILDFISVPVPKIKPGRVYKLKAAMSHYQGKENTIVLSYDDNVETFRCSGLMSPQKPVIGANYTVEKIGNNLLLTPC